MSDRHAIFARVCVDGHEKSVGGSGGNTKSHDGAALPPRGRVLRTRRTATATTTNYTLALVSSSIGRENNVSVYNRAGGYNV